MRKTKTRTLLTNKREVRPSSKAGVKLEKIPETALSSSKVLKSKVAEVEPTSNEES